MSPLHRIYTEQVFYINIWFHCHWK